jgi:hypothetical protein
MKMPAKILRKGHPLHLIQGATIPANDNIESQAVDVYTLDLQSFGLQWEIESAAGTGAIKIEVLTSINGVDFLDKDTDVATGQNKAAGSNGAAYTPTVLGKITSLKVKLTETATTEDCTANVWIIGF